MKELSIEEKAKRYDEAIERAKEINNEQRAQPFNVMTKIFPELKESEDERIREKLIEAVKGDMVVGGTKDKQLAISWLEKQGEQRPIIVPKFMVGDFIKLKDSDETYEVSKIEIFDTDEIYYHLTNGGCVGENADNFEPVEQKPQGKPALEAAKEEKVYNQNCVKPADKVEPKFKVGDYIKHNKANIICKVVSVNSGSYYVENIETGGRIELFNAEQNFHLWAIQDVKDGDVLATDNGGICIFDGTVEEGKYPFAYCGVTERGFEIYDRKLPFTHTNIQPATKEQRDTLMKAMADAGYTFDFEKKELKKIKQKPAWSEDDDDNLSWLVEMLLGFDGNDIECYKDKKFIDKCKEVCKWLKVIKDRTFPQPKQEWGEEDEKYLIYNIEQDYRDKLNNNPSESLRPYYNKVISLLKSIRHQKQWKPSDEQMYILNWVTNLLNDGMVEKHAKGILESLYNDLKKLKA